MDKSPGKLLAEAMQSKLEPHEIALFLQETEANARRDGDLEMLRAIRDYRNLMQETRPTPPYWVKLRSSLLVEVPSVSFDH